jgi:hypothetical protein
MPILSRKNMDGEAGQTKTSFSGEKSILHAILCPSEMDCDGKDATTVPFDEC